MVKFVRRTIMVREDSSAHKKRKKHIQRTNAFGFKIPKRGFGW